MMEVNTSFNLECLKFLWIKMKMKTISAAIFAAASLYTLPTLATNSNSIIVGECSTINTCSMTNMRKSLTSSDNGVSHYLIKNTMTGQVTHYTAEFATSEFGQDRYIVRNKGIANYELSEAVNGYVRMAKSPNDDGLDRLGFAKLTDHIAIGPVFGSITTRLELNELAWRLSQLTQAIAQEQALISNKLIDKISSASISGSLNAGKLVNVSLGGTLTFDTNGLTTFGIKEGPAVFVISAKKIGNTLELKALKLVLLDADGNQVLEIPFDGLNLNMAGLNGQVVGINSATQTLWKNSFLSNHFDINYCTKKKCTVTIEDPKPK